MLVSEQYLYGHHNENIKYRLDFLCWEILRGKEGVAVRKHKSS